MAFASDYANLISDALMKGYGSLGAGIGGGIEKGVGNFIGGRQRQEAKATELERYNAEQERLKQMTDDERNRYTTEQIRLRKATETEDQRWVAAQQLQEMERAAEDTRARNKTGLEIALANQADERARDLAAAAERGAWRRAELPYGVKAGQSLSAADQARMAAEGLQQEPSSQRSTPTSMTNPSAPLYMRPAADMSPYQAPATAGPIGAMIGQPTPDQAQAAKEKVARALQSIEDGLGRPMTAPEKTNWLETGEMPYSIMKPVRGY